MLLGIVLHGAISFIPGNSFWAVQDAQRSEFFGLMFAAIHGFRMPLFFLISGFFTAMLWRKRGLRALVHHRFKRIFLPMLLGLFTIIPLTWAVSIGVAQRGGNSEITVAGRDSPEGQLMLATLHGDSEKVAMLIDGGVDLQTTDERGSTPLHIATFFGYADVASQLIGAGADTEAPNNDQSRPADMIEIPWGMTRFFGGMAGLDLDKDEVLAGREEIARMLAGVSDLDGEVAVASGVEGVPKEKSSSPAQDEISDPTSGVLADGQRSVASVADESPKSGFKWTEFVYFLMYIPLFGHLWFLWFLCWLVLGFVICAMIGRRFPIRFSREAILSCWRYAWLLPVTAIPQWFMGEIETFGPDTSIGLIPIPTVMIYYAIFFGFGAIYFDTDDQDGRMGKEWRVALPLALFVAFPVGLATADAGESSAPLRVLFVLCQVAYAWLLSFGLMGLFRHLLSRESKTMRYLSDSSYWLYLAHIPLIILLQAVVRSWKMSPLLKFSIVCVVTSIVLLISYELFVRYTPIGTMLNGRRQRPKRSSPLLDAAA